jgi:hypothetical protein
MLFLMKLLEAPPYSWLRWKKKRRFLEDKSDPLANSLIEGLKEVSADPNFNNQEFESSIPSVATKDVKLPIKSEWWDKYLYLGLLDYA